MSLLVTGSIGIDTVETPMGMVEDALGGSAVYFSLAASLFTPVRMVGAVGEDFDKKLLEPLEKKGVDTAGVEFRKGSKTFRWHGKYVGAMNDAETVCVDLNVLSEKGAPVPDQFRDSEFVFLANTHPSLQREFANQFESAKLIVCDTMNLWIETEQDELRKTLKAVHGLVLNEGEARLQTQQMNLVTAGRKILEMGPKFVVIKKGEHGSLLVSDEDLFLMPPFPTEDLKDPTGAGDSFAGGMLGYIASQGNFDKKTLRDAMARGSVVASFVLESFSIDALAAVTTDEMERRLEQLRAMAQFS
jgi:sugar/nucleoside kinase (ribokinase family)